MDAKDVKSHVQSLEKALKDGGSASTILDILNSLKKNVVATEQLLRVSLPPPHLMLTLPVKSSFMKTTIEQVSLTNTLAVHHVGNQSRRNGQQSALSR